MSIITAVSGRGLPLRGDDLDTDRIMPARFLKAITFEGLEHHLFEDDRLANPVHPFNDRKYQDARILVVNRNFGCGSSREHAPQGIARAGFTGLIGESFSEIFQGNAVMLGLPCFTAERSAIDALQTLIEHSPETVIDAQVTTGRVRAGGLEIAAALPPAVRDSFVSGQWNPTAMLLDRYDEVRAVAKRIPYIGGFTA